MKNITAIWNVELNCTCQKCDQYVNLIDYPDFWYCRDLEIPEHGTQRSNGVEVVCPECGHEFAVDCEY